jgi:anti-sigma factor RsiW
MGRFRSHEIEAFLDEALSAAEMARIEDAARRDPEVREQVAAIRSRRDCGLHSLGEIWRRHRLSCPTREQLGSYLLGALEAPQAAYVRLHLEQVGCRYCEANLQDLESQRREPREIVSARRSKYFQSSAGCLRKTQ